MKIPKNTVTTSMHHFIDTDSFSCFVVTNFWEAGEQWYCTIIQHSIASNQVKRGLSGPYFCKSAIDFCVNMNTEDKDCAPCHLRKLTRGKLWNILWNTMKIRHNLEWNAIFYLTLKCQLQLAVHICDEDLSINFFSDMSVSYPVDISTSFTLENCFQWNYPIKLQLQYRASVNVPYIYQRFFYLVLFYN